MSSLAEPGAEAVQPSGVGADGADGKQVVFVRQPPGQLQCAIFGQRWSLGKK